MVVCCALKAHSEIRLQVAAGASREHHNLHTSRAAAPHQSLHTGHALCCTWPVHLSPALVQNAGTSLSDAADTSDLPQARIYTSVLSFIEDPECLRCYL